MKEKKKYKVSRVFATKFIWTVEANSKEEALQLLNDDSVTPTDLADEEWLGRVESFDKTDMEDTVKKIK